MSYPGNRPGASTPMNPIVKGRSRPSSGVGMSLLDVIGNDVKVCVNRIALFGPSLLTAVLLG